MNLTAKMLITLSIIGIASGGLLSKISNWAAPKIEMHKKADTEKAIFNVLPEGIKYERLSSVDFECYKVLGESDSIIGFALPYEGNGFQGKIRLMTGLKSNLEQITAIEILDQIETPGLGTKITEQPFRDQFNELKTVPKVEWVKGAPPSKPNEIQAITGATISCKAVVAIINEGLKKLREAKADGEKL